jgi:hypothetical protein
MRSEITTDEALIEELRGLLRAGLPVRVDRCGPVVLGLHGVRARAQSPDDPGSRARALDGVLREQLHHLENGELAGPARLLFGDGDPALGATLGATLTARRVAASVNSGYEVNHFRKRIEPKILELLAWQLRRDSETFTTRSAQAPRLRTGNMRPVLPPDVFVWEATDHQHAVAALWGAVYLLRAELLTVARLVSMTSPESDLARAAQAALWRHALVLAAAARYRAAYGAVLLEESTDLGPDQIAAFAGWTPGLTPAQELLLAALADPAQGLADFTSRLTAADGGTNLAATWRRALTGRPSEDGPDQEDATTT